MKSFDDRIREVGGFGLGYDFLCIGLAFAVMGGHALAISAGADQPTPASAFNVRLGGDMVSMRPPG